MRDYPSNGQAVCELLGCAVPVVLAGMGGVARSELVSAVAAFGGFGFLGMVREPVALIEREVVRVRSSGHRSFGVNIIPAATDPALLDSQINAIIELQVPVVELFWDIDIHVVDRLRDAGIVVVYQVGSVGEAVSAERAGAQIIVAQGVEAGGHVRGVTPLRDLLPAVVRAVKVPVLAAGGLARGTDMAVAMAMGAEGVVLGTALMATSESFAHPYHQQRLVEGDAADTVLTGSFHINWPPNAPVRVLRSAITSIGADAEESRIVGEEEGRPIHLFSTDSPLRSMTGDYSSMALYAGTGVGAIDSIMPTDMRLGKFLEQAAGAIPNLPLAPAASSPVCFAGEMSGVYMGHAEPHEIADALSDIVADMHEILRLTLAATADEFELSRPPFCPEASPIAGWILLLHELCIEAKVQMVDYDFVLPPRSDIELELSRRYTLVRHALAKLLPRLPDNRMQQLLAMLGSFVVAASPPGPSARSHSDERQVATSQ
jgi:nitronate monooxygenase